MTSLPPIGFNIEANYMPRGVGSLVWLTPLGYRAVIWFHGSVWGWPALLPARLCHEQCYDLLTEHPTRWERLGSL